MRTLLASAILVALSIPAAADRFECYPIYQAGGGDTRRIVVSLEFSRQTGEATYFSVVHQLGSGGSRDRELQAVSLYLLGPDII